MNVRVRKKSISVKPINCHNGPTEPRSIIENHMSKTMVSIFLAICVKCVRITVTIYSNMPIKRHPYPGDLKLIDGYFEWPFKNCV